MTLLNNIMTNTIHSLTQFIQFQLRADTSGTDVNVIIVLTAVQLDLVLLLLSTGTEINCSVHSTMCKEDS